MIGIPGPCKAFPRSTHLFGKNESGRITATALIADLSIVKDEGDFGRMGWAGAAIIGKGWCCAKCHLPSCLSKCVICATERLQ